MKPRLITLATGTVRVPNLAILLLALSAATGNLVQFEQRGDLKAQVAGNNVQTECRSRIANYVEGLGIELDIGLGNGLFDRLGPNDDEAFAKATDSYFDAVAQLTLAKTYRENSVEVCAVNPDFDPETDIPKEQDP